MIRILQEIAAECNAKAGRTVKVSAKLDYAGVMVTVERRDDSDCGALLISWEQLTAGNVEAAQAGIRATVKRVRGF